MTNNEKYLEECKITRDSYMDNAENSIDGGNSVEYEDMKIEIKKAHALEIIAEELIKHNKTFACVVAALENIDTALMSRR